MAEFTVDQYLEKSYAEVLQAVAESEEDNEKAKWNMRKLDLLNKQIIDRNDIRQSEQKIREGKKDRWVKIVVAGVELVVPIWASWIWMRRSMQFEETGVFRSRAGEWVAKHFKWFHK